MHSLVYTMVDPNPAKYRFVLKSKVFNKIALLMRNYKLSRRLHIICKQFQTERNKTICILLARHTGTVPSKSI